WPSKSEVLTNLLSRTSLMVKPIVSSPLFCELCRDRSVRLLCLPDAPARIRVERIPERPHRTPATCRVCPDCRNSSLFVGDLLVQTEHAKPFGELFWVDVPLNSLLACYVGHIEVTKAPMVPSARDPQFVLRS